MVLLPVFPAITPDRVAPVALMLALPVSTRFSTFTGSV
jgi:hypothetical protein